MNREIKFRGKSIDNNEWVYGDLIQDDNKTYIKSQIGYISDEKLNLANTYIEMFTYEVIPETVGQCIGIKDMYKKEIYEHDIVIAVNISDTFTGIVIYDLEEQDFKLTNGEPDWHKFSYLGGCEEIEKLGNKFDNPELLKEID